MSNILVVGLGNPGKKYIKTRHNAGFEAVDFLVGKTKWNKNAQAECTKIDIDNQKVTIIKPQTFMNNSGVSVAYAVKKHHISSENIIVILVISTD